MPTETPTWEETSQAAPTWDDTTPAPTWDDTMAEITPDQMDSITARSVQDEAQRAAIGRGMESGTEFLTEVANDPAGFAKAIPEIVTGAITAPGRLAYDAAADLISAITPKNVEVTGPGRGDFVTRDLTSQFGGNLRAGMTGQPKPVDTFLGEVSRTNPKLAVAGKVGRDLTTMAPLGVVAALPAGLARLATAGFSAQMIAHAPALFKDYAEEIAKPAEEQDPDKLTELKSGIIQTFAFAPLAGAHASRGAPAEIGAMLEKAAARLVPPPGRVEAPRVRQEMPVEEGAVIPERVMPPQDRVAPIERQIEPLPATAAESGLRETLPVDPTTDIRKAPMEVQGQAEVIARPSEIQPASKWPKRPTDHIEAPQDIQDIAAKIRIESPIKMVSGDNQMGSFAETKFGRSIYTHEWLLDQFRDGKISEGEVAFILAHEAEHLARKDKPDNRQSEIDASLAAVSRIQKAGYPVSDAVKILSRAESLKRQAEKDKAIQIDRSEQDKIAHDYGAAIDAINRAYSQPTSLLTELGEKRQGGEVKPPPLSEGPYKSKNEELRAQTIARGFIWDGNQWVHPDYPGKTIFSTDVPQPSASRVREELAKLRESEGVEASRTEPRPLRTPGVPNERGEYVTGTKDVAQRLANAEKAFISFAIERGELTEAQAAAALDSYKKNKAVKIQTDGQFQLTHGGFAERDVLRRAAGLETPPPPQIQGRGGERVAAENRASQFNVKDKDLTTEQELRDRLKSIERRRDEMEWTPAKDKELKSFASRVDLLKSRIADIYRSKIREKQDRVIAIAERRGMSESEPISSLQEQAPTVKELREKIWPKFEESIDSFLSEFERPEPPPTPEIKGMGGAVPAEYKPSQQPPTALKNAAVDAQRAARGETPLMKQARESDPELFDRAMAEIDRDWQAADKLVERFREKRFTPTNLEGMVLLHRMVDLKNEVAKLQREQARAAEEGQREMADAAKAQHDVLLDQLTDLERVVREMGSMQGSAFRMRQLIMQDDFTLANLIVRREAALKRSLKPEERAELERYAKENATLEEKLEKRNAEVGALNQDIEAKAIADRAAAEAKAESASPYVIKLVESIVKDWDSRADRARARLKERMSRTSTGIDPTILVDLSEIGLSHLGHAGLNFAKWADRMIADVGEWAKPHLDEVFKRSQQLAEADVTKRAGPKKEAVKKAMGTPTPVEAVEGLVKSVAKRFAKNPKLDFSYAANRMARYFWEQGIHDPLKLVDAIHQELVKAMPELTKREAMDALSYYGRYRPLRKDAISAGLRDARGQLQQIAKLDDLSKTPPTLSRTGFEQRTPSDAERRYKQQVEEKKKEVGYQPTDPETQLRSAWQAAERRMDNQMTDLLKEIETGERLIKKRYKLELDQRLQEKKDKLDFIREVHAEVFKKPELTEAQKLAKWKKLVRERIEIKKKQWANRDFQPRKRPEQPRLDKEALQLRYDLHKVHNAVMDMRIRDELSKRNKIQKVIGAAANLTRFQRALATTGEFSAALRQGGVLAFSHPIISARALYESFKAFKSEKEQFRINEEIQLRDNAPSYQKDKLQFREAGMRLSTQEELYMFRVSEALKKVDPNAGLPKRIGQHVTSKTLAAVEAFQRQFNTFLNKQAADVYDALVEINGKEAGRDIAEYINIANGRGSSGVGRWVGPGANTIFFAPRYAISRLQYLAGQPIWGAKTKIGRKLAAKEYARTLGGAAVVYAMGIVAGLLNGQSIEETISFDPRDSDFGKIKIGNTRIDPLFGLLQWTRLLARESTGTTVNRKGMVRPLRDVFRIGGPLPKRTATEPTGQKVAWQFGVSKLAPYPAITARFIDGEAYGGKQFSFKDELVNAHMPMTYGDVYDAMVEQGVAKGTAIAVLAIFGMGVQTYDENAKRER